MVEINFAKIEKKWQGAWEASKVFEVSEGAGKSGKDKKKFYVLEMFPYPSGDGLHMGHALNYVIGDVLARYKIMNGFKVLHPMGYDALGLPAENAAIKAGKNPKDYTDASIKNFIRQQKGLGITYDWSRMVSSADSSYYKWDQWIFLKMLEGGLAYQKVSAVNWCPKCDTVLANEQVHDRKCWRHENTNVELKHLKQWFFKITDYADELYEEIDNLKGWPERTKAMQKNWIGRSEGTEIDFEIETPNKEDKISNVVIVHGCPDSNEPRDPETRTYEKHWRLWLSDNLEKRNIKVDAPLMPEPWVPDYKKWKREFDKLNIDEDSILVGHSCGCAFLVRWLGQTNQKIKKLILVAPWKIPYRKDGSDIDFYNYEIDKGVKSNVGEIVIFTSDNEEKDGKKSVKLYEKYLGGKIIELKNQGHFTFDSMGTHEFPKLLEEILQKNKTIFPIFTTRPDTLFGVTFMVVSAQHSRLDELVTPNRKKEVDKFLKKIGSVSQKSMKDVDELNKEGVFTGSYAINPATNKKIPIWAGNFVVADYGSGMVMAVPAHDQRDFEFAKKYGIEIKQVISGKITDDRAYTGEGKLINSGEFDSIKSKEAIEKITDWLIKKKLGRRTINFKLRDWLISRQRYWGTPIPIIHCDKCGAVPVPEKDLPVELPKNVKFGKGNPLENAKEWIKVKCPKCGAIGKRETDTMDTFVNSSWYFLRYCDSKNDKKIFDLKKANYWCPIDQYIGGSEHACMHLIYFRFYTKFLADLGLINFREPAKKLFHQGMLAGEGGVKMSKSKGNVINPEVVSKKYGIDTARYFLLSLASPDKPRDWSEAGIQGSLRFINKIFKTFSSIKIGKDSDKISELLNKTIKEVGEEYESFDYRTATIKLKQLFDAISEEKNVSKDTLEKSLKLLNPICPHITEELWEKLGNKKFISTSEWPKFTEVKTKKSASKEDLNKKVIEHVSEIVKKVEAGKSEKIGKVYVYVMPFEIGKLDEKKISNALKKDVRIFAVNDSKKYDPNGMAKRAVPGRAAVYVE